MALDPAAQVTFPNSGNLLDEDITLCRPITVGWGKGFNEDYYLWMSILIKTIELRPYELAAKRFMTVSVYFLPVNVNVNVPQNKTSGCWRIVITVMMISWVAFGTTMVVVVVVSPGGGGGFFSRRAFLLLLSSFSSDPLLCPSSHSTLPLLLQSINFNFEFNCS